LSTILVRKKVRLIGEFVDETEGNVSFNAKFSTATNYGCPFHYVRWIVMPEFARKRRVS